MYCKIFVHGPASVDELLRVLQTGTGGTVERRTLELRDGTEVDVRANDDSDPDKAAGGAGNFLFFPYYLDVEDDEPDVEATADTPLVATAQQLLAVLSDAGFVHVVAADFEELLPGGGDNRPRSGIS